MEVARRVASTVSIRTVSMQNLPLSRLVNPEPPIRAAYRRAVQTVRDTFVTLDTRQLDQRLGLVRLTAGPITSKTNRPVAVGIRSTTLSTLGRSHGDRLHGDSGGIRPAVVSAQDVAWVVEGAGGLPFFQARRPEMLTGPLAAGPTVLASSHGEPVLVVTGYEQARRLLIHPRFSRAAATGHPPVGPASAMSVTEMDPPRHSWVRGLVGRAFSPSSVRRLVPTIRRRALGLVADIRQAGPPVDLVSAFCAPFAFAVHCDLLGVPEGFRGPIRCWSLRRSGRPGSTAQQVYDAEIGLHQVVTDALMHMRHNSGVGLWGELLIAREQDQLTETELTGLASALLFDGHILAAAQIALATLWLVHYPDQALALATSPCELPRAVEELLRFSPSITLGMPRKARSDVDLAGLAVRAGQTATVCFGLTGRDRAAFGTPDRLDLTRGPNQHLSFGYGIHHCLGASIMRVQLRIVLEVLLRHLPHLEFAAADQQLAWSASHTIRSLTSLPLTWSPTGRMA